ncbi:MAG: bifunctional ornithine acetyltransferase/N-acetylglutamate synthase [Deltaproteobacteria bacterium CG1_02_45_11]|nr:MAG: bifunctional ornithine acetyltransferase/N-acetylglutamate synthase [Deltaproteobacteria bacterium CG1_02_45_11]
MKSILCPGFTAAGVAAGLKGNDAKDLGLIYSKTPANVAGLFTSNKVQAAPVILDKERIKSGVAQAVIVNSGNANCCTGDQGMLDAQAMTESAASRLGISEELVLVASTGVIGKPLDMKKIAAAIPGLIASLAPDGFSGFARAIMTTDTVLKAVSRPGDLDGKTFTIAGVAKGAGMIHPDMATMLCLICTDLDVAPGLLKKILKKATDRSFNRITIDGDTSTNDTIIIMANGLSGAVVKTAEHEKIFQGVLDEVLISLARMIVKDGEGATKLFEIVVNGALSDQDAYQIANTVANSNLVKTALFGEDANWGRIMAAVGRSGADIEPDKINILFNDVLIAKNGIGCGPAAEAEATQVLKMPEFSILVDLKMGNGSASVFTCDLSVDYVKINAHYRS